MQVNKDVTITINDVMELINKVLEQDFYKNVAVNLKESAEDYEKYNAVVGTTFDEDSWKALAEDETNQGPLYLYAHIPVGLKTMFEDWKESSEEGGEEEQFEPISNPAVVITYAANEGDEIQVYNE